MPEPSVVRQNGGADTTVDEESDDPRGFALSVDLSACVGADARCRVWVGRRRSRRMRWLAGKVRRAALLRGEFLMLANEEMLPPAEPLRLLCNTDTLRVARVEHEWQRPFSFHDDSEEAPPTETAVIGNVRKRPAETQASPPRSLSPVFVQRTSLTNNTLKQQESPPQAPVAHGEDSLLQVKRRALALLQQVTGEQDGTDNVDAPKKRRRRVRRRRPARPVSPFTKYLPPEPTPAPRTLPLVPSVAIPLTSTVPSQPWSPSLSPPPSPSPSRPLMPPSTLARTSLAQSPLVSSVAITLTSTVPSQSWSEWASQPESPSPSPPQSPPRSPRPLLVSAAAPAPVLRNSSARAPRVVRALGATRSELMTTD